MKATHDYLIDGIAPQENAYQMWLATIGQQLEFDEHSILYRRCPDLKRCVIYVPDVAREVVVREAHTVPLGSIASEHRKNPGTSQAQFLLAQIGA